MFVPEYEITINEDHFKSTGLSTKKYCRIIGYFDELNTLREYYLTIIGNSSKVNDFLTNNRHNIFDLTNTKQFYSGLITEEANQLKINSTTQFRKNTTKDHIIQRKKFIKIIMNRLVSDVDMTREDFIDMLINGGGYSIMTKDEHSIITELSKKNKTLFNYELYKLHDIKFVGSQDFIDDRLFKYHLLIN